MKQYEYLFEEKQALFVQQVVHSRRQTHNHQNTTQIFPQESGNSNSLTIFKITPALI